MKRKYIDARAWDVIVKRGFIQKEAPEGVYAAVILNEVSRNDVWHFNKADYVVTENGMVWLQFLPYSGEYRFAGIVGTEGARLWYIDAAAGTTRDENGDWMYDDAYLDLIVTRDGEVGIDDRDELDEAYREGDITKEIYECAIKTLTEFPRDVSALDKMNAKIARVLGIEYVGI